jgi:environmental stress-induced protein Ves
MMRILRAAQRASQPWKNGGGMTREVMVWPQGADFARFDWRVSIAEVKRAGPFSTFEGIERTLMILKGSLELDVGGRKMELSASSAPFSFDGEAACSGIPRGGSVTDLNVMVRRGRFRAKCESVRDTTWYAPGQHTLVVAASPTAIASGGTEAMLAAEDALYLQQAFKLQVRGETFAIVIRDD